MHSSATDRRSASKCRGKCPDQTLDQAFGLSEVLVAVSTSRLSCKRAGKTRTLMPVWDSSGESRFIWGEGAEDLGDGVPYRLNTICELTDIDRVLDWAVIWGERRKAEAAAAEEAARATNGGKGFNSDGCAYSVDQIEHFVREGAPPEANRSELFHTIIGHYLGCGWDQEKIFEHLQQFRDGIGGRYLSESRLRSEISRSASKYGAVELPWSGES